ncbi:hypothetical protein HK405_005485, partial [Cladochytrium tenue]
PADQPGVVLALSLSSVKPFAMTVGVRSMSPDETDDGAGGGEPHPILALDPDDGSLEGWGMAADLGHFYASDAQSAHHYYQPPKPLYSAQNQQQQQQSQQGWRPPPPRRTPSHLPGAPVLVAYSLHTATTPPPVPRYSPPLPLWPNLTTSSSSATPSKSPTESPVPSSQAAIASSGPFAMFAAAAATEDDNDAAAAAWRDLEARLALRKLAGIGRVTRSRRPSGGATSSSQAGLMTPSSPPTAPQPASLVAQRAPPLRPPPMRPGNAALLARLAPHLFGRPGASAAAATAAAAARAAAAAAAAQPSSTRGAPSAAARPARPSPLRVEAASWAAAVNVSVDVDAPRSAGESATKTAPATASATGGLRSRAGSDVSSAAASLSTAAGSVVIHDSDDDEDDDDDASDDGGFDD